MQDKFDYGTQLSPCPIRLSIGTLVKPKLIDIAGISFGRFNYYEYLMTMTPKDFYTDIKKDNGKDIWESMTDDEKDKIKIYDIIIKDKFLAKSFCDMLNFFFEENVFFLDGYFIFTDKGIVDLDGIEFDNLKDSDVHGVISEDGLQGVLFALRQVCCIEEKQKKEEEPVKFKNSLAEKLYKKMQKAAEKEEKKASGDVDYTIPNLISAISNKHPTLNPINIWDLTVFQLLDSFKRMCTNFDIDLFATRVSVWGDEKKEFNAALWYKNTYDKK